MFGLCQIHAFVDYVRARMPKENFQLLFKSVVLVAAVSVTTVGGILTFTGKISPWTGRFYSLLDPSYAKNNIPIIASVSEHQPTTWSSFYFDLQLMVFMFPVGLYYCFYKLTDANIFIIMYGVTSIYFAVSEERSLVCLLDMLYLQPCHYSCSWLSHQVVIKEKIVLMEPKIYTYYMIFHCRIKS